MSQQQPTSPLQQNDTPQPVAKKEFTWSQGQFDKSLQDVIFKMLCDKRYMFYGLFLAELNKGFDDNFETAAVGKHKHSATINLILGKAFWEKTLYNESRRKSILIHELEHVIREHLSDMSQNMFGDRMIANIAMDISINQTIVEELPRLDENGKPCGVYLEDFKELKMNKDESSLYYYNILLKGKEEKKASKARGEDSKAKDQKPGNGAGTSGDKALDGWLDAEERGKIGDWHGSWKELTDGMGDKEKELLRKEIQEMTRRIAEESLKVQGHVPVHISNSIKENFGNKEPIISWRTLFNRFVGSAITTDIYQTRKRPNFRFPDAPTNKYKSKIRIVVGMDSSGSVSDHDLHEFFAQTKHMWKAGVKVDVVMWDACVHLEYEYKGENKWERVCQGGTHASSFTEYVNENVNKKRWTCAIGLTDGYVESKVTDATIPMLWVITQGGSTSFENKAKKIKIN